LSGNAGTECQEASRLYKNVIGSMAALCVSTLNRVRTNGSIQPMECSEKH
jgi:hypothetical protein